MSNSRMNMSSLFDGRYHPQANSTSAPLTSIRQSMPPSNSDSSVRHRVPNLHKLEIPPRSVSEQAVDPTSPTSVWRAKNNINMATQSNVPGLSARRSAPSTQNPSNTGGSARSISPVQLKRSVSEVSPGSYNRPTNHMHQAPRTYPGQMRPTTNRTTNWRNEVTDQERRNVQMKLVSAYKKNCPSYEELLIIASALEEEYLHILSKSSNEYFQHALSYGNKVSSKK